MATLIPLWLPIITSAVLVFIASSIIWMALPIHKNDYKGIPDEDAVMATLRKLNLTPGVYVYPWCHGGKANQPAAKEKFASGPWGQFLVAGGPPTMGSTLGLWFVHLVVVSVFVAYVTGHALPHGAAYLKVFQIAGSAAILAHGGGLLPRFIWEGKPWAMLPGAIFDAAVYTLLTAGAFGWLWPKAT